MKTNNFIKMLTLILLSVFLSIFNIYPFIVPAADVQLIIITTIILFIIYYFIISKLIVLYNRLLNFINQKISKNNLKNLNKTTQIVWFPSALISAISSLILFFISNRYMIMETNILGDKTNYGAIVTSLNTTYFPIIMIIFLMIGLLIEIFVLKINEKEKTLPAFLSSFITILVFTIIFFAIRNLISNILAWL